MEYNGIELNGIEIECNSNKIKTDQIWMKNNLNWLEWNEIEIYTFNWNWVDLE